MLVFLLKIFYQAVQLLENEPKTHFLGQNKVKRGIFGVKRGFLGILIKVERLDKNS